MDPYDAPRTCSKCKHKDAIPAGDKRLSCLLCREKTKERQRKYRIKEREDVVNQFENERDHIATTVTKSLKRKRDSSTEEYQSADGLYKALRTNLRDATSLASHHLPSFRGCFSIVIDPSVNHLDRARAVTKDLKKVVKYPLANLARDTASGNKFARITADCQCLTLVNMAGSSSSSTSRPPVLHLLNSVASSRTVAVANEDGNGDKLVEALQASFERNCGGKVKILVKGDFSHPLGISGQKVTVKVVH